MTVNVSGSVEEACTGKFHSRESDIFKNIIW